MDNKVFSVVCLVLVVLAMMVVSYMDYQDELAEQRNYCNAVEMKLMPDYKHIYQTECVPLKQQGNK